MAATTFIYALKELTPGEYLSTKIRYIGKADDPYKRFDYHCKTKERNHRGNWIRGLPARRQLLQLEIIDEVPEAEWQFWEKEYIRLFRAIGFNLVNETEGGEGWSAGCKHSKVARLKASESKRGAKNPNFGKSIAKDVREKMRAANLGKKFTPEHCKKISDANLGRKLTPEQCKKISESKFGKTLTSEHRLKIGISRKAAWERRKNKS